jgi:cytochrome c peroxidase
MGNQVVVFIAVVLIWTSFSCSDPAPAKKLIPEEEKQIQNMARSYFLPLSEVDFSDYSNDEKSKVLLGKKMFYDKKFSKNQTQNCASCHDMERFGQDNLRVSPGDSGVPGVRNVPTVLNAHLQFAQFWDAHEPSVEEQAPGPIFGTVEMGMTDTLELLSRIASDPEYPPLFEKAFPEADTLITLENIKQAIGAFERTLNTPGRFDDYLNGDLDALSYEEKKGIKSFIDQGCIPCHSGVLLGGNMIQEFAIFGYYWDYTGSEHLDKGVYKDSKKDKDMFFFKVPGLRNVAETHPYFHDGSIESLEESIRIMGLSELNAQLLDEDVQLISAFLQSLTGEIPDHAFENGTFPFE